MRLPPPPPPQLGSTMGKVYIYEVDLDNYPGYVGRILVNVTPGVYIVQSQTTRDLVQKVMSTDGVHLNWWNSQAPLSAQPGHQLITNTEVSRHMP